MLHPVSAKYNVGSRIRYHNQSELSDRNPLKPILNQHYSAGREGKVVDDIKSSM